MIGHDTEQATTQSALYGNRSASLPTLSDTDRARWQLDLAWHSQFDNREMPSSSLAPGRTLFGLRVPLAVRFQQPLDAHHAIELRAGGIIGQDFGDEPDGDASEALLQFRLHRQAHDDLRHLLIIGSLDSSHELIGALRDSQRVWQEGTERGLQWLVTGSSWQIDTWIDWERIETADQQEAFTLGHSGAWEPTFLSTTSPKFGLTWQALWYHEGGQQTSIEGVRHNHSGFVGLNASWQKHQQQWRATLGAAISREEPRIGDDITWGYGGLAHLSYNRDWDHGKQQLVFAAQAWLSDDWQAEHTAPTYRADQYFRVSAGYRRHIGPQLSLTAHAHRSPQHQ